ncbi:hypothetical protein P3342_007030 [Pyrenophora teres f. teres]|nr:hypothetical protein P3342_007030 [Pyrenophora teres f. teres]
MQRARHIREHMPCQPIVQGKGLDDRKGELRYDFKFPNTKISPSSSVSSYQGVNHRRIHTVAPAQTLGTPPASSSSFPSTAFSEATGPVHPDWLYHLPASADQYREDSSKQPRTESTLTLFLHGPKKHGFYCNLKMTVKYIFWSKEPSNKTVQACKHKFRNTRCKKCDLPESIAYLCGLRTGAVCKEHGKGGCEMCIDVIYGPSGDKKENSSTTPIRPIANTDACSQLTPSTCASIAQITVADPPNLELPLYIHPLTHPQSKQIYDHIKSV